MFFTDKGQLQQLQIYIANHGGRNLEIHLARSCPMFLKIHSTVYQGFQAQIFMDLRPFKDNLQNPPKFLQLHLQPCFYFVFVGFPNVEL